MITQFFVIFPLVNALVRFFSFSVGTFEFLCAY